MTQTTRDLAIEVKKMRRLQRAYFRSRSPEILDQARQQERHVDQLIEAALDDQPRLFGDDQ